MNSKGLDKSLIKPNKVTYVAVYQTKRTSTIGYARVEKESSVAHNVEVPGDPIKQVYKV